MNKQLWPWLVAALLSTGCLATTSPGDRYFEMGSYGEASREYALQLAADKPVAHRDQVLYRLAISYAIRRSPAYDLAKAQELFAQLIEEYPESSYGLRAETLLGWIEQAQLWQLAAARAERRSEELRLELARLRERLETADSSATEIDDLTAKLSRQIEARDEELRLLAKRLAESSRRIRQLTTELDELKRLDLADPP